MKFVLSMISMVLLLVAACHISAAIGDIQGENVGPAGENTVDQISCCSKSADAVMELVNVLQTSVDKLTNAIEKLQQKENIMTYNKDAYRVVSIDNATWRPFWWFKAGSTWPGNVEDVLQDEYGLCDPDAPYCFGRLPSILREDVSEMLGVDSAGNQYRWKFQSQNSVAHAVWRALRDHVTGLVKDGTPWMPKVVKGTPPKSTQDSFQYRIEHGVFSLLIDDDNCDCQSSLSIGHGLCLASFSTQYGPENVFGVDLLHDTHCQTPNPNNGLTLYFRDDDDCANVKCPSGTACKDGVYSYRCE